MKKVSAREAVVAALGDLGSASAKSLVSYTKKPKPQVATALWKLKGDGKVSVKDGTYKLVWGPIKLYPAPPEHTVDPRYKLEARTLVSVIESLEQELFHTNLKHTDVMAELTDAMARLRDAMAVIKYLEGKLGSVHA